MAARNKAKGRGATSQGKRSARGSGAAKQKWSARVMQRSDALDLEEGVFKKKTARQVALSLKRSAEHSHRRKAGPYASAMSMLNFHINRAGRQLPPERRKVLTDAKGELRRLFHREA